MRLWWQGPGSGWRSHEVARLLFFLWIFSCDWLDKDMTDGCCNRQDVVDLGVGEPEAIVRMTNRMKTSEGFRFKRSERVGE